MLLVADRLWSFGCEYDMSVISLKDYLFITVTEYIHADNPKGFTYLMKDECTCWIVACLYYRDKILL